MNARAHTRGPQSAPPAEWVAAVDRDLVALGRGAAALRLALGDGLALLRRTGGAAELGFPDLGAYTLERLGRRRRWAEETARVAEQLAALPLTRAALAEGLIAWSMAELLARAATADTEATLLATASDQTVRGMRAHIAAAKAGATTSATVDDPPEPDLEPDDERRTLQLTVDRVSAWAYELTRSFVHAQTGAASDDAVIEALLAEGMVTLQLRHPELKRELSACARATAWDQQRELERRLAELMAEDRFRAGATGTPTDGGGRDAHRPNAGATGTPTDGGGRDAHRPNAGGVDRDGGRDAHRPDGGSVDSDGGRDAHRPSEVAPPPRDPVALDAHLRALSSRLQRRDGRLGELARRLWEVDGWSHLGFASPTQYAHERLGCSLAAIKARMTLARRCELVPEVAVALADGALGFEAARLVSRVADPTTVDAWLQRAACRTVKHLQEEVEAVETIARADGLTGSLAPPDADTMEQYLDLERAMLDGTVAELLAHGGQMSGDGGPQSTPGFGAPPDPSQMSGEPEVVVRQNESAVGTRRGAGRVALRLRLGADLVAFWRDVERLFRDAGEAGEFVDFLIRTFWHEWLAQDPGSRVAYHDVYERERFRCASPVCNNRDLTPHHLVFRSRGGGEERSNLVGLCVGCHLELVHQGRLRAEPPADHVRWTLGRAPLLVVDGRRAERLGQAG